jgi:hypothetical protein
MSSFQIFLKDTSGSTLTLNDITNETPISELKRLFNEKKGVPIKNIRLIFSGKDLNDRLTVKQAGISKESTIYATYRSPSQGIVEHPRYFFGDSLNNFIIDTINTDDYPNKSVIVIGGSKLGSLRNDREKYIEENTEYHTKHDLFKQQLPLPLIIDNYKNEKDIHLFLIDPAFKNGVRGEFEADIYPILQNTCEKIDYGPLKVYVGYVIDILKEIKLNGDILDHLEDKEILINVYVIPYSYSENDKNMFAEYLDRNNTEYSIYLKNIPHQRLENDNFISNSKIVSSHKEWHNMGQVGGTLPKQYTASLSKKDKKKQIKAIKKASKDYQKGKYTSRPKLKSFKSKKSNWTSKFEKKYGEDVKTYKQISKATGVPVGALKAVVKKGMGAYYSSGSRPNQTAESWGKARMYSYIMGGPTRKVDHHITEKFGVKF